MVRLARPAGEEQHRVAAVEEGEKVLGVDCVGFWFYLCRFLVWDWGLGRAAAPDGRGAGVC